LGFHRREDFAYVDSLRDRGKMDVKSMWIVNEAHEPSLQNITFNTMMFGQPCSFSGY